VRRPSRDYIVIEPADSVVYDTTLDALPDALRVGLVIVTGIAGNICVRFMAHDACMRDLRILAPADCIVSNSADDNAHALRQAAGVLRGVVTPSTAIRFRPARRHRGAA